MAEDRDVHPIESQLQEERAASLGRAGRRVEAALAALEAAGAAPSEDLVDEAATAVWYYMIVRESLRMYDHKAALAVYRVPSFVLARVGVVKR